MAALRAQLASLWAGQLLTVGLMAAPNAFASLNRPEAGLYVASLFRWDARISVVMGVLLLLMEQRLQREQDPQRLRLGAALVLPLAALLLTLVGAEVLQPMIEAAKRSGSASFGPLHAASMGVFWAKVAAVAVLAWRVR